MSKQVLMRVRGLEKNYPRQRVKPPIHARLAGRLWGWTGALDEWDALNEGLPVLRGVDLDIHRDETLAIVGESGAGKSTLLHLIGALDRPTKGAVLYQDTDLASMKPRQVDRWRNTTVGFVFQFYHLFPDLDALDNVLLPAMVAHSALGYWSKQKMFKDRARHLLDQVGLGDRTHHRPSQLSGGEQQRVAIARALILEPTLLLCDEPTGNLDRKTGEAILELLWKLKAEQGQTYVIVTHDDRLAMRADRVVRMLDGKITGVEVMDGSEATAKAALEPEAAAAPQPAKEAPVEVSDEPAAPAAEADESPAEEPARTEG